jgi:glycogen operon protein
MSDQGWHAEQVRCLGVRLAGDLIGDTDERGEPVVGETTLLLLNAHHEPIAFTLPATRIEHLWETLLDTAGVPGEPAVWTGGQQYPLRGRSLALLCTRRAEENGQVATPIHVDALAKEGRRPPEPAAGEGS